MTAMKFAQRLVIGSGSSRQITEAQVLANALFELARSAYADSKTIQPYFQHQSRIVGSLPANIFFLVLEAAQIERLHHLMNQETKMIGTQDIFYMGRQQFSLIG